MTLTREDRQRLRELLLELLAALGWGAFVATTSATVTLELTDVATSEPV